MRSIYTRASHTDEGARNVVIWLGIIPKARVALGICSEWKRLKAADKGFLIDPDDDEANSACKALFVEPAWWSRVWILQEVIHSNEAIVYFGLDDPVDFDFLCEMYRWYQSWMVMRDTFTNRVKRLDDDRIAVRPKTRSEDQDMLNKLVTGLYNIDDRPRSIVECRAKARKSSQYTLAFFLLLVTFRFSKSADDLDKIYALLGMAEPGSQGANIPIVYDISKNELYTKVALVLMSKILVMLCAVEAPEREVGSKNGLPSWVPDYTTQQYAFSRIQLLRYNHFSADKGFPAVKREPRLVDHSEPGILVLRGVYIGVVTSAWDKRLTDLEAYNGLDTVRLIRYDVDRAHRHAVQQAGSGAREAPSRRMVSPICAVLAHVYTSVLRPLFARTSKPIGLFLVSNSRYILIIYNLYLMLFDYFLRSRSWGPCHTQRGDVVIVAAGSRLPLVLRPKSDGGYFFVGVCWLIRDYLKINHTTDWDTRSAGFSPIMFGGACEAVAAGNGKVEMFRIA